jgi:S-adenosylmethionine-diacylglycerol 3-amino-3-carboxypropyl transferase
MSVKSEDQVELSNLLFGMSWEDPGSDRRALQIQPGDTVVTISSGGCNTLTLLLEDPGKIHAVDINPSQSHLLELKCAAVRRLDYEDLHAFLGLTPSNSRLEMFESLSRDLSKPALQYWRRQFKMIRGGIVYQGRYEAFLHHFRRLLRIVQGKNRIEGFFKCQSLEEQQQYFDRIWNTVQWRMLFRLAFNKRVLAKRGLSADYFRFDDGASSFAGSFFQRSRRAFREIPVGANYFLAQYLLGRYVSTDAVPDFLRKENLPVIRERLGRIDIVTADAKGWLTQRPGASIDGFSLSNICELMSPEETERTFEEVSRTARPGARICFRNLMVPREVQASLTSKIRLQVEDSRRLLEQDRSFVYSRVQAYVVATEKVSTGPECCNLLANL